MKRLFFLSILLCGLLTSFAQKTAMKVLDDAAASFKKAGGVKVAYTYSMNGQQGSGTIMMLGQKFKNDLGEHVVWFNGKTMWTLVKSNEEVNVTEPTAQEIASMNPYAFVSMYKKGFNASFGKSTKQQYEIILKSNGKQGGAKQIVLRLNKSSLQPTYVKMTGTDGNAVEITVTSFAKGQKYNDATFTFNPKQYPDVEVVDLR